MRSTLSNPSRSWRQCGASSTVNGRRGRSPCQQAPNRDTARSSHRLFELVEVELADLRDLRRDHRAAVALVRVAAVVIAVVLLRRIELLERRSEEHTSELQSHSDLVCRLLLEKKKKEAKER